jgi:hypothetical protein
MMNGPFGVFRQLSRLHARKSISNVNDEAIFSPSATKRKQARTVVCACFSTAAKGQGMTTSIPNIGIQ